MKKTNRLVIAAGVLLVGCVLIIFFSNIGFSAYHHMGDTDSETFLRVYSDKAGTKLDSCALCHRGGTTETGTQMGNCQWCHYKYGYDASGNIDDTLNPYGMDYKQEGRSEEALLFIETWDSDGDGYSNKVEIAGNRYPGDPNDTPAKVPAPYRVYTREQLEEMVQHTQFMLMNASRSTDFYAQYSGVTFEDLLQDILLSSATGIRVFSPDGFSTSHPFYPDPNPNLYHVFGVYPEATFHYDAEADIGLNPGGWCDYSAPSVEGRNDGDPITNHDGLKFMLAITRNGEYLTPGVLNLNNRLDGEGPFRAVPPQKVPSPPDQRSNVSNQNVRWPYNRDWDHNSGFSTRSVTMIQVEPLPPGTTDIDTLEAGWKYVDEAKIVVYGAIDPVPNIFEKLDQLASAIEQAGKEQFKTPSSQQVLIQQVSVVKKQVVHAAYSGAVKKLQNGMMQKTDGCISTGAVDRNDWVMDCNLQRQFYWALHEVIVLLNIPR